MHHIRLGLSVEELTDIFNEAVRTQEPTTQREVKERAKFGEFGDEIPTFPPGTSPDLAVLVSFAINAIRLNNLRLQEQLKID